MLIRFILTWLFVLSLSVCRPAVPSRPHIVVYVIDTLRADRLGLYGYDGDTSANIDALGASGVVFEQASAPAPWTLPSVTSLLLSQLPCEHGVLVDRDRIAESSAPLPAVLQELGYRTASFHANPYAGRMSGLDRGFDTAKLVKQDSIEERVAEWLDSRGSDGSPFLLYIHTVEPHNPELARDERVSDETRRDIERWYRDYRTLTRVDWDAQRPIGETDNSEAQRAALARLDAARDVIDVLYDAAVREADERLARIRQQLERRGLWEDTLFVLLSDHGEELGDRGGWQHDQSVYEELIRVPLVFRFPGDRHAGRREPAPVALIDVVPTVLDYLDVTPPGGMRGRSLLQRVDDDLRMTSVRDNRKKYFRPYRDSRGDVNVVLRRGPWKGIWNADLDTLELYQLSADPSERRDASLSEAAIADAVREYARLAHARCGEGAPADGAPEIELDAETRRHLESLGYLDPPR